MLDTAEIEQMSVTERLQAMERLWTSLSRDPAQVESPAWHGTVLKRRLAKVDAGKAEFLTLAQLKKRLGKRGA